MELFTKVIVPAVKAVEVKEFQELSNKVKHDVIVDDLSRTAKVTFLGGPHHQFAARM